MINNYLSIAITKHSKGWNAYKTFDHGFQSGGKRTLEWALYEAFEYGKAPTSKIITINGNDYQFIDILKFIKNDYIKEKIQKAISI